MKLIRRPATCLVAVAFALGVATAASAQQSTQQGGVLEPDSLFDRGRMSVGLNFGVDGRYTGPVFKISASGHGSASVEVYDIETDTLLGTVTGKLTSVPDFDNAFDLILALSVTFNRVDSGTNACTS
jgi:hypothetical protein